MADENVGIAEKGEGRHGLCRGIQAPWRRLGLHFTATRRDRAYNLVYFFGQVERMVESNWPTLTILSAIRIASFRVVRYKFVS